MKFKPLATLISLAPLLFIGCGEDQSLKLDGKTLLTQKCSSCHNLDMPAHSTEDEKAPPMMAVSFHVYDFIDAVSLPDRRSKSIEFVVDFVENPSVSKSFCDKKSLASYGLMPSLKGKVSTDEVRAIARYMFSHYTQKNLLAIMKRNRELKAMPQGRRIAAQSGCLSCHAIKKKKVGPSFHDIALKKDATQIDHSIREGSKGMWEESRNIPMPAFGKKLSNSDIKIVSDWILEQK
ncbi:c-type cytochrome [Sulfurospirillum sp. 1612]|uniref:c-type cytochrome n=1 Tax=Sulfurospirillum sp. 1612 TaxID=3094835 RepID=UPI002F92D8F0